MSFNFNLNSTERKKVFHSELEGYFENYLGTVLIGVSIGVLMIAYVIWNRVFRQRVGREIAGELWSLQFWIILILFILTTIHLIFYAHKLYKYSKGRHQFKRYGVLWNFLTFIENQAKSTTFTAKLITSMYVHCYYWYKFIKNYILGAPLFLWRYSYYNGPDRYVLPFMNKIADFGFYLARKLYRYNYRLRITLTTVILSYLPRLLSYSVFLYEILIYKKLELFYWVAPILLITLGFISLRRIWYDISEYELYQAESVDLKILRTEGEYPDISYVFQEVRPLSEEFCMHCQQIICLMKDNLELGKIFYKVGEGLCGLMFKVCLSLILSMSFGIWILIILGYY